MQYSSSSSLKFAAMELPWKLDYAATSKTAPPPLYLIFNIFQVLQNQDRSKSHKVQRKYKATTTGSLLLSHDGSSKGWVTLNTRSSEIPKSNLAQPYTSQHKCTAQPQGPPVTLLMSELLWRWITHLARVLDIDKGGGGLLLLTTNNMLVGCHCPFGK